MPLGMFQLMNGYLPRAMLPSANKIKDVAKWGGVVGAGALFMTQPWGFLAETLGLKKPDDK